MDQKKQKIFVIYNPTRPKDVIDELLKAKVGTTYRALKHEAIVFRHKSPRNESLVYGDLPPLSSFDVLLVEAHGDLIQIGKNSKRSNTAYGRMVRNIVRTLSDRYRYSFQDGLLLFPTLLDAGDIPKKAISNCLEISKLVPETYVLTDSMVRPFVKLNGAKLDHISPADFYDYVRRPREPRSPDLYNAEQELLSFLSRLRSDNYGTVVSYSAIEELTGIKRQKIIDYMQKHDISRTHTPGKKLDELDESTVSHIRTLTEKWKEAKKAKSTKR